MQNRGIKTDDLVDVLIHGEIIEEYADDKPYPSWLIYGDAFGRPIHIVCA